MKSLVHLAVCSCLSASVALVSLAAPRATGTKSDKPAGTLVDRAGSTGFIQIEAESFNTLTARQKELAYWLSRAAIAIDPIIYDQNSRFGLRQKYLLEMILSHPQGVQPLVLKNVTNYVKLFWSSDGNHNGTTAQKFLPDFTFEQLQSAALAARAHTPAAMSAEDLKKELSDLRPSMFDPDFEPMATAKTPKGGLDIIQGSANNFYGPDVTLADLKNFAEKYPLNSRVVKGADGTLTEEVYRAGTVDGSIPPGRYARYLNRAIWYLEKARAVAEPGQPEVIDALIRYYRTGDPRDWIAFGVAWVHNNKKVDFANGFIEVYRDARGAKGTSQSFVSVTDEKVNELMTKLAANAQYFENKAPWADQYKKQGVQPPQAKAIETVIETGDFSVTTVGDNLPNENEVREKDGTKSFLFTGSTRALNGATGHTALNEFAWSDEEKAIGVKYGTEASDLLTAMHEIIGHGSGKVNPKLTEEPLSYLKEYGSTLEEGRADLVALWNVWDPKLAEIGLISNPDVGKAMYSSAARAGLYQLRSITKGDTIEEDHQRDRQMIVNYIMDKTGAIEKVEKNGKTYMVVRDFDKMHQGVGMLLAELMRIKAEGDYDAIKKLVDTYGVHFDPALRDQVVKRYKALDLPTYWYGVNPDLTARVDSNGKVVDVTMSYPRDVVQQQLGYSLINQ
ncbi:MAG: peptidase M49 [Acidobacteriota bacterium]